MCVRVCVCVCGRAGGRMLSRTLPHTHAFAPRSRLAHTRCCAQFRNATPDNSHLYGADLHPKYNKSRCRDCPEPFTPGEIRIALIKSGYIRNYVHLRCVAFDDTVAEGKDIPGYLDLCDAARQEIDSKISAQVQTQTRTRTRTQTQTQTK